MWLTRVAINRRVTISMVILSLVVMGFVGLSRMPWSLQPDVEFPFVFVSIPYPGAGPEEIEQRILKPLEDAVSVINGVKHVESTAQENFGTVGLEFDYSTNVDVAAADVRDALDRAKGSFPTDSEQPSLLKINTSAEAILVVGITGSRAPRDLRKLVDDEVAPALGQVPGVANVSVSGGETREIQVLARKERLDAVGLSISEFARLLAAENLDVPGGNVKEGTRDYAIRVKGEFESLEEIRALRIKTPAGGLLPVSAVADVQDTVAEPSGYARVDGQPNVTLSLIKQSNANTVAVARGAIKVLTRLFGELETEEQTGGDLPEDLRLTIAEDSSERVLEAIKDVRDALVFGALLAALVVFLFLHNFRGTLIVAIAIPASMMATFFPIGIAFGFTLNTMVMLALSLATGILVDDSIVVLENIERHLRKGEQPKAAAFNGRTEIGGTAVAITLVDVVVFIPVAMMGGIVGRFFYPFGITSFICTAFSLLMSFTLTPMLASWWYTRHGGHDEGSARRRPGCAGIWLGFWERFFAAWETGYAWLQRRYARALRVVVKHPYITVATGYALLVGVVIVVMPRLGFEFFPASDAGLVDISVEAAAGTRLEETDRIVRQIEALLLDKQAYPEVKHVTASSGGGGSGGFFGGGSSGSQYGQVSLALSKRRARVDAKQRSDQDLARDLRKALAGLPSVIIKVSTRGGMGGGGGGADLELNILCENSETLGQASADLVQKVRQIPGLLYVDLSAKPGRPEVRAQIDRLRAADLGMTAGQIGMAVRTAFAGDTSAKFRESGDEYDLRVQLAGFDRQSVSDVEDLYVGRSADDQPVRLRDVAKVYVTAGPSRVERYNRQRKTTMTAYLDPAVLKSGGAQQKVDAILKEWTVPGITTSWTGMINAQTESFSFMVQALGLAICLVYLVTAALYNSPLQPMNIMLTIPMAMVGGILGLWITGNSLSIVAMIGIIQLVGLVGKNSILLVDYTNTLRARGAGRTEALLEAGPTRMRPILMTTAAATMGALPTALAVNEGSEWRAPMAIVVIFGLLVSTLLSLLVVPATYAIWDQLGVFIVRMGRGAMRLITGRSGDDDGGEGDDDKDPEPPAPPLGEGTSELSAVADEQPELPGPPVLMEAEETEVAAATEEKADTEEAEGTAEAEEAAPEGADKAEGGGE